MPSTLICLFNDSQSRSQEGSHMPLDQSLPCNLVLLETMLSHPWLWHQKAYSGQRRKWEAKGGNAPCWTVEQLGLCPRALHFRQQINLAAWFHWWKLGKSTVTLPTPLIKFNFVLLYSFEMDKSIQFGFPLFPEHSIFCSVCPKACAAPVSGTLGCFRGRRVVYQVEIKYI